jgi:hypothetical protein
MEHDIQKREPDKGNNTQTSKQVEEKPQEESDQEKEYKSISEAMNLLIEVKDIRDELNILSYLLTQQKTVWQKLLDLSVNEDGTIISDNISAKEAERWRGPGSALKDIAEMDKIAQRIQDSVRFIIPSR